MRLMNSTTPGTIGDNAQEKRTDKGDPPRDPLDVFLRAFAGTNTGDKAAVALQLLGKILLRRP